MFDAPPRAFLRSLMPRRAQHSLDAGSLSQLLSLAHADARARDADDRPPLPAVDVGRVVQLLYALDDALYLFGRGKLRHVYNHLSGSVRFVCVTLILRRV